MGNICNWLLKGNGAIAKSASILLNPCKINLIEE